MNHRLNIGLPVLIVGLVLCGLGLWLLFSPPYYKAVAQIKIEPETAQGVPSISGSPVPYDPYFMETELKRIESEIVLSNVVQALNLDVEWRKRYGNGQKLDYGETIELLRHHLVLDAERNTKLVDIGFIDQDPVEAAQIANAIPDAYLSCRLEEHRQQMTGGIKILEDKYQIEENEIKNEEAQLEQLSKQFGLTNSMPSDDVLKARYSVFYAAKKHLGDQMMFHELLETKIYSEMADMPIPRYTPVTLINPAVAPKDPIAPNRWYGVLLLVCGLVASFWGFYSLFISDIKPGK